MYTKCHMHNTTAAAVTARDLACGKHWYSRPKKKISMICTMLFLLHPYRLKRYEEFHDWRYCCIYYLKRAVFNLRKFAFKWQRNNSLKSLICVSQQALQIFSFISFFSPFIRSVIPQFYNSFISLGAYS